MAYKKTKEFTDLNALEKRIVSEYFENVKKEISSVIHATAKNHHGTLKDIRAVCRKYDLNIDKNECTANGTSLRIEFVFSVNEEKMRKKISSWAIDEFVKGKKRATYKV